MEEKMETIYYGIFWILFWDIIFPGGFGECIV